MDETQVKKLRAALKASWKAGERFRVNRINAWREIVGLHYGEGGNDKSIVYPFASLYVSVYGRNLYAKNPQPSMSTPYPELKPLASAWELATSKLMDEIDFESHGHSLVLNALTSPFGIMKVGLNQVGEVDVDGQTYPIGRPYAKVVDLDDWVHDSCARTWDEMSFCGNRYRVPLEWVKKSPLYDSEVTKDLKATEKYKTLEDGGVERISTIGIEENVTRDEYQEYVELWDLWLPYENKIITISCQGGDVPLSEQEYDGYKGGPYHRLSYLDVPHSIYGLPPISNIIDIHQAMNSTMRKLVRQAEREKEILAGGDEEDMKRVTRANDGESVHVQNPQKIQELKFGGPDAMMAQFSEQLKTAASWFAGNLDSLGGLGAQTETLGQDQLINASTSRQLQEMQDRTVKCFREIVRHLAWLQWADNLQDMEVVKEVAGMQIPTVVTPEQRASADFMLFNVGIDPVSMQQPTPQQKLQVMQGAVAQTLPQLMPILQMQGKAFDAEKFWNDMAKMSGVHELKDLIIHAATPPQEPQGSPQQPPATKPPVTTRTSVRVNRGGDTREARGAQMQNSMSMLASANADA